MTDVVVDLGKTTCRARALTEPPVEARGAGAPGLAAPKGTTAATAAIAAALSSFDEQPTDGWGAVSVGAAGALADPGAAARCAEQLAAEVGAQSVIVTSDAVTAHLGALGGSTGVVVVAGTGSVAVHLDEVGGLHIADGAGPDAGDRGSGAWIGLAALRRAADGSAQLAQRAEQRFGADWRDLLADGQGYELARRRGEFVADVRSLARMGDLTSVAVIREAAEELAQTAREAAGDLDETTRVSLVGGLSALGPVLTEPLGSAIRPARLSPPDGDALDGAALLIARRDLPHEAHVHRFDA